MGGCQNCGHFFGTLNIMCGIIIGIQKRTIILTTTHISNCLEKEDALVRDQEPTLDLERKQVCMRGLPVAST